MVQSSIDHDRMLADNADDISLLVAGGTPIGALCLDRGRLVDSIPRTSN